jgi:mevalonate kinase
LGDCYPGHILWWPLRDAVPAITAKAPGKAILLGEHAVVYGRPAIAVPVTQVQAQAAVFAEIRGQPGEVWIEAPGINFSARLSQLPDTNSFTRLFKAIIDELKIKRFPALHIKITSTIPIAAGLGSGTAVSVAVIRALSAFVGRPLPDERVSALAFEQDKIFHGTPSGIDNTVVTYAQPVFFVRAQPFQLLQPAVPFTLVIGDTGARSPTAAAVAGVRERRQADIARYDALFDRIANITVQARICIETGELRELGLLLDQDHQLLQEIGVSNPELDRLVGAAREAGAWGAKLSGGGLGGNMIAVADSARTEEIAARLQAAGAVRTWVTEIKPT